MSQLMIFLDDGGVMNDTSKRTVQWQRLVSEFFVSQLGGIPEAWIEANRMVFDRLLEPEHWRSRILSASDYASFNQAYQLDWLQGMCEVVGIAAPPEDECVELVRRAEAYIIPRVRAALPGLWMRFAPCTVRGTGCIPLLGNRPPIWVATSKGWRCVIVLVVFTVQT
jgi:hypothetical protein